MTPINESVHVTIFVRIHFFIYLQPGTEDDIASDSDYEEDNEDESSERNKNEKLSEQTIQTKHSSEGDDNLPFSFNVLDDLSQSDKVNNVILHEYKDKTLRCLTIDCT